MGAHHIQELEKKLLAGDRDPFAWYALGIEYVDAERYEDAVKIFARLRELHPTYLQAYFPCATLHHQAGRKAQALEWLEAGRLAAKESKASAATIGEFDEAIKLARGHAA